MKKIWITLGVLVVLAGFVLLSVWHEWRVVQKSIQTYFRWHYGREQMVWEYPFSQHWRLWKGSHRINFSDGDHSPALDFYAVSHPQLVARLTYDRYGARYDNYGALRRGYYKSQALKKRLFKAGERGAVVVPSEMAYETDTRDFVVYWEAADTLAMQQLVDRCIALLREEQRRNRWMGLDVRFTNKQYMDEITAAKYSDLYYYLEIPDDRYRLYYWHGTTDEIPQLDNRVKRDDMAASQLSPQAGEETNTGAGE